MQNLAKAAIHVLAFDVTDEASTDTTEQVLARIKNDRVRHMMEAVAARAEELNALAEKLAETMVNSRTTASLAVNKVDIADNQTQKVAIWPEIGLITFRGAYVAPTLGRSIEALREYGRDDWPTPAHPRAIARTIENFVIGG